VRLAGTLTIPEGQGPFPAVVLVSCSSPQDRDESVAGHKPFLVLADDLTRRGISVLRYDDRGQFGSTGDFDSATTEDLAGDALAAVEHLTTRPEVDAQQIGVIGHSEGGYIAPMVAVRSARVAFIVLLAGLGISGEQINYAQLRYLLESAAATEPQILFNLHRNAQFF
jgi:dienelactone hydrolase